MNVAPTVSPTPAPAHAARIGLAPTHRPASGIASPERTRKSSSGSPSALSKRKASLSPGMVTLVISCDSLMRGRPFTSTNLYTMPNAGWAWHVTCHTRTVVSAELMAGIMRWRAYQVGTDAKRVDIVTLHNTAYLSVRDNHCMSLPPSRPETSKSTAPPR